METLNNTYHQIKELLSFKLITIDGKKHTLWTIINYYSDCYSSQLLSPSFKTIGREFCQNKIDTGVGHGIVILFKYLSITIGIIIILSSSGLI
jgi:hypothetical protein